jgi:predicted cupin superfamily sugar epimerase
MRNGTIRSIHVSSGPSILLIAIVCEFFKSAKPISVYIVVSFLFFKDDATTSGMYHGNMQDLMPVEELVSLLSLAPHPEGGYFRQTYASAMLLVSPAVSAERPALTDIYYLLARGQRSRFHRVLHDEIWHFYEGEPLVLYDFNPDLDAGPSAARQDPPPRKGNATLRAADSTSAVIKEVQLGGLAGGCVRKHVVPAGHWQAAEPLGLYSLVGCTVAPGFDFSDFSFLDGESREATTISALRPDLTHLL